MIKINLTIQWSILKGDKNTGTAIMAMEEGLDTGPVLAHNEVMIGKYENAAKCENVWKG